MASPRGLYRPLVKPGGSPHTSTAQSARGNVAGRQAIEHPTGRSRSKTHRPNVPCTRGPLSAPRWAPCPFGIVETDGGLEANVAAAVRSRVHGPGDRTGATSGLGGRQHGASPPRGTRSAGPSGKSVRRQRAAVEPSPRLCVEPWCVAVLSDRQFLPLKGTGRKAFPPGAGRAHGR